MEKKKEKVLQLIKIFLPNPRKMLILDLFINRNKSRLLTGTRIQSRNNNKKCFIEKKTNLINTRNSPLIKQIHKNKKKILLKTKTRKTPSNKIPLSNPLLNNNNKPGLKPKKPIKSLT